ncbi:unnamed protein product [Pleuronectes platessa]|uniref:Uncharacterized protein n=1 Tax=Pleuronectes platessa TaxID=8262 RepID=A0A9N7VMK8_PLEPL|nr:unnamed protein product [Pleuronectes platessa]
MRYIGNLYKVCPIFRTRSAGIGFSPTNDPLRISDICDAQYSLLWFGSCRSAIDGDVFEEKHFFTEIASCALLLRQAAY